MRFEIGIVAALLIFSSCASTEDASQSSREAPESEFIDESSPGWYSPSVESSSDSTAFYGYSHAIASNRTEAAALSEEVALTNLRFEIDRYAEKIRSQLEEEHGSNPYGTSRFIINLRNSVQGMDLSNVQPETEYFEKDGITNAFTKISIPIEDVVNQFSENISDSAFIRSLRNEMN